MRSVDNSRGTSFPCGGLDTSALAGLPTRPTATPKQFFDRDRNYAQVSIRSALAGLPTRPAGPPKQPFDGLTDGKVSIRSALKGLPTRPAAVPNEPFYTLRDLDTSDGPPQPSASRGASRGTPSRSGPRDCRCRTRATPRRSGRRKRRGRATHPNIRSCESSRC